MNDKKILVVEDDKDLISLVKFNLKSEGFNVLLSPKGKMVYLQQKKRSLI